MIGIVYILLGQTIQLRIQLDSINQLKMGCVYHLVAAELEMPCTKIDIFMITLKSALMLIGKNS